MRKIYSAEILRQLQAPQHSTDLLCVRLPIYFMLKLKFEVFAFPLQLIFGNIYEDSLQNQV